MLFQVFEPTQSRRSLSSVIASSVFHAGPWALAIAIAFGIYAHAAPWAPWFFGAAVAWVLFVVALGSFTVWRIKRGRKSNAV